MTAFERHYRVKELARLWGLSANTVTRMFVNEAGVLRVDNIGSSKRKYITLSIPESVALRVHERLSRPAQPSRPMQQVLRGDGTPLRVIRLGGPREGSQDQRRKPPKR